MRYTMEDINLITEALFYKERSGCLTSLTRVLKGMFFIKDSNLGNEIQAIRDYTDRLFLASQTSVNIKPRDNSRLATQFQFQGLHGRLAHGDRRGGGYHVQINR